MKNNPFKRRSKQQKMQENRQAVEDQNTPDGGKLSKEAQRLIEESRDFEKSKAENADRKSKLAFKIAMGAGAIAVVEAIALASLVPLKTVEPYVIRVDNATGFTDVQRPLADAVDTNEAMNRFFVRTYVNARESYDWNSIESDFSRVRLMSTADVFSRYSNIVQSDEGVLEVLGERARAVVNIKNITFIDSGKQTVAQVRFSKSFQSNDGTPLTGRSGGEWLASLTFNYPNADLSDVERAINPLNFRVNSYRLDRVSGGDQ
ncbi:virB8 family protein [Kushneria indalinina]|uniref:Type IV secretion system protein VirB8 n=1 Tax=Kushneria indalinina DSM 14324 TaxID=1122140 RepID=A0A3D9DRI8_9GAMM|nr:VirB8/TrbF family protein [Kushneria indalinina]REC93327.1 type IV secretion system protein VirB8 [Kushneria indalinina DSM 14324]